MRKGFTDPGVARTSQELDNGRNRRSHAC
ncbi:hypothetical protein [Priestia abyssalis]